MGSACFSLCCRNSEPESGSGAARVDRECHCRANRGKCIGKGLGAHAIFICIVANSAHSPRNYSTRRNKTQKAERRTSTLNFIQWLLSLVWERHRLRFALSFVNCGSRGRPRSLVASTPPPFMRRVYSLERPLNRRGLLSSWISPLASLKRLLIAWTMHGKLHIRVAPILLSYVWLLSRLLRGKALRARNLTLTLSFLRPIAVGALYLF